MRVVWTAVLLAACTTAPVEMTAAPGPDGALYVRFAREREGPPEHVAAVEAGGGRVVDVVHAPDRRSVQVLWAEPQGMLSATFPYGESGAWRAGQPRVDEAQTEYVFLEHKEVVVTGHVPAACPLVGTLQLDVKPAQGPLVMLLPGRRVTVEERGARVPLKLPRDEHGGLVAGDLRILFETAQKTPLRCVIAVDGDGVVAAVSGYIRNSTGGLD